MLTLLGPLLGGLFRLAPEWMKYLNGKQDRAHEVTMFGLQLDADKARATAAERLETVRGENAVNLADMQALVEATKAQAARTGIKAIDALNSSVRPVLTYWWCLVMYSVALAAEFYVLTNQSGVPSVQAIIELWGEDEKAIVASMLSFWFVDRSLRRQRK